VADDESIFEHTPAAAWKVGSRREIRFPVCKIRESASNRLVERDRPYRQGAKIDSTGSKAKRWSVTAVFENTIEEPGVTTSSKERGGSGVILYPGTIDALLDTLNVQETGDLTLPTRGVIRCRFESYEREESDELRDAAMVTLVFVEDNEERIGAQSFASPRANANARRLAETTTFSAQSDGAWGTSLADLNEFASELEAIANFPGDTVKDLDSQAAIVIGATNRVLEAFTDPSREGRDVLLDPDSSATQRKLHRMSDLAGRSRALSRGGKPRLVARVFPTDRSLFDIAAFVEQEAGDLINANPALDPLNVPAGTPVRVFE
jgi:hypothetical protein